MFLSQLEIKRTNLSMVGILLAFVYTGFFVLLFVLGEILLKMVSSGCLESWNTPEETFDTPGIVRRQGLDPILEEGNTPV